MKSLIDTMLKTKDRLKKPKLICHPDAFCKRMVSGVGKIGANISLKDAKRYFDVICTETPYWLTKDIVFLGRIPRKYRFESTGAIGKIVKDNKTKKDFIDDDSSLAYRSRDGLVIITGCAHSGICNTIEHAREVCGEKKIAAVIGGFHLLKPSKERLMGTLKYFKSLKGTIVYPCHCTDLRSKIALSKVVRIEEVGAGMEIRFN